MLGEYPTSASGRISTDRNIDGATLRTGCAKSRRSSPSHSCHGLPSPDFRFALWCLGRSRIWVQSRLAGSMCAGAFDATVSHNTTT